MTANVALAPQPGSQVQFLACPAREVLYEGTRGNGKTLCLLMDYLQDVGKGHGSHWRGILFRETYPQLADVISKSKEFFWQVFPTASYNKADHVWTFPEGETLSLRHMASPDDYWNYHGHEYCTEVGTGVLTPTGWRRIESLRVGDEVSTPSGGVDYVSRVFSPSVKSCVKASFYDDDTRLVAEQVQSEDHRFLSTGERHVERLSESSRNGRRCGSLTYSWPSYKSLLCGHQENQGASVSGSSPRSSYRDELSTHLAAVLRLLSLKTLLQRTGRHPWLDASDWLVSILRHVCGIWPKQAAYSLAYQKSAPWGLPLLLERQQLFADRPAYDGGAYGQQLTSRLQGSLSGYHPELSSCGAQSRTPVAVCQDNAPSQAGVPVRAHSRLLAGVPSQPRIHSPSDAGASFSDPYGTSLIRSAPGHLVRCEMVPCGLRETVDVTIAGGKSYITTGGIVNSNCWIGWEELTNWANPDCYDAMKACNRSSHKGMPRKYRATCNPWGKGHGWVKARFIDPAPACVPIRDSRKGWTRVRVHGDVSENKILTSADPEYIATLDSIEDEALRKAWRFGDWDIAAGGIFTDAWSPPSHVVAPFEIPAGWEVSRSFDWGSSRPFSVGWWARANGEQPRNSKRTYARGTWVRIAEWYGWNGKPNQGCHMLAAEVARGILEREKQMNLTVREGVADAAIFDNGSGLSNESIATTMERLGVVWTPANKGPGSRAQGWEKMRELFTNAKKTPMEKPGLVVFETCRQFIRTVPTLLRDDKKPDDIDSDSEDHCGDETRYRLMTEVPRAGAVNLGVWV